MKTCPFLGTLGRSQSTRICFQWRSEKGNDTVHQPSLSRCFCCKADCLQREVYVYNDELPFVLRWLWLDKVALQQRASSHPINQKGRSRVLPAVFMGNTVSEPKNCSKWATWHNTFNSESLGDCFLVLGWKNLYVDLNVHPQQNIKINFL